MAYDDPAQTDSARTATSAKYGSDRLRFLMNRAFEAEAARLGNGVTFEDAKKLLMNGVRL